MFERLSHVCDTCTVHAPFPGRAKTNIANCFFLNIIIKKHFAKMLSQPSASQQPVWDGQSWPYFPILLIGKSMPRDIEDCGQGQRTQIASKSFPLHQWVPNMTPELDT